MRRLQGIWAAVLTPIAEGLEPDAGRAAPYYHELLRGGCDGINVLGTTGEAMSFSTGQRIRYMEALASDGLPMDRAMAGTGASSLDDAVRLTRAALDCGFTAALVMPPFFHRDASDEGVVAFFDALLARVNPPPRSVLLYNFPRMSGITFSAELVDRLVASSEDRIFGMKDSSNDARLQKEIALRHPGFCIFPGSESDLLGAKSRGAAGCISGSVALWARFAKNVFESEDAEKGRVLDGLRAALDGVPFVPAVRHLTAAQRSDPQWERVMPPQRALSPGERGRVDALSSPD
ncbi:MAG TPA: dihydrodipicolinate synthase family protein [Candidatus Cybelea sp.]|jgi:4-hydroxy-tetrahydrodipicolinate synthase